MCTCTCICSCVCIVSICYLDPISVVDIEDTNPNNSNTNDDDTAGNPVINASDDWIEFQSTFNKMIEKSEIDLAEAARDRARNQLREEVLIQMMSSIHGEIGSLEPETSDGPIPEPSTKSVSVSTEDDTDPVISQTTSKRYVH